MSKSNVRMWEALDVRCPNSGLPVPNDTASMVMGGVEVAPCEQCQGAVATVFHTSEGRRFRRYSGHDQRQLIP